MVVLLTGGVGGANRRPSTGGDAYGFQQRALFLHVLYLEQVLVPSVLSTALLVSILSPLCSLIQPVASLSLHCWFRHV